MAETIGNPLSWSVDKVREAGKQFGSVTDSVIGHEAAPQIRRLDYDDLRAALREGFEDFTESRSDVIFLCILYPIIGVTLAWLTFQGNMLPLIFPVISGFALVGPVAGVGLYEMSRRREMGMPVNWGSAFSVVASPSFGAIVVLALMFGLIFIVWLMAANGIYAATLGPEAPASLRDFARDVFTTGAGWVMIIVGMGVGFLFAAFVLAISVVSFPLLLDRDVGVRVAVMTSIRVTMENPRVIAAWGLIVAIGLGVGSLPVFLGLIVVLPVLGHSTWRLYRRAVVAPQSPAA
jgi:uncharacterized membrane protein